MPLSQFVLSTQPERTVQSARLVIVGHTWCAQVLVKVAIVAGGGIHFSVADAVPFRTDLVAHAAVRDGVADSAVGVAGVAGGTVLVSAAPVGVADSVVTDLNKSDIEYSPRTMYT